MPKRPLRQIASKQIKRNQGPSKPLDLTKGFRDEEISSEDESIASEEVESNESDNENSDFETVEQKRKRLATEYLASLENSDNDSDNDSDVSTADILARQRLSSKGQLFSGLSKSFDRFDDENIVSNSFSGFEGSVTCVAFCNDGNSLVASSKDGSVQLFDVESGKRKFLRNRWKGEETNIAHEYEVLTVATSGNLIAYGGRDRLVHVYDVRAGTLAQSFSGHRDTVTSLCFRTSSNTLYSGSADRTIKHWNLDDMAYVETLFGHQDNITSMDCGAQERPITCSSDHTIRLWKVSEQSHLVYRGAKSGVDVVKYLSDDDFVSGSQDGSISLWKAALKKPKSTISAAHGFDGISPRWISSIAVRRLSDLVFSGSHDGQLRIWKADYWQGTSRNTTNASSGSSNDGKPQGLLAWGSLPLDGFINSIAIAPECRQQNSLLVAAGTGREHRLGRWWTVKGNKNKVWVYRLTPNSSSCDNRESIDNEESEDSDELGSSDEHESESDFSPDEE